MVSIWMPHLCREFLALTVSACVFEFYTWRCWYTTSCPDRENLCAVAQTGRIYVQNGSERWGLFTE
jgi:hypothetical protein